MVVCGVLVSQVGRQQVVLWTIDGGILTPKIRIDRESRDLGVIRPGDQVKIDYVIENAGKDDLIISDLRTSCECSPAKLSTDRIPGGGSATLAVALHVPLAPGPISHAVMFRTNDVERPEVRLT